MTPFIPYGPFEFFLDDSRSKFNFKSIGYKIKVGWGIFL